MSTCRRYGQRWPSPTPPQPEKRNHTAPDIKTSSSDVAAAFERQRQARARGLVLLVRGIIEHERRFANVMGQRAWRLA